MNKRGLSLIILLACALSACGSTPSGVNPSTQAYWSDPWWQTSLLSAVQSVVHQTDMTGTPITGVNATVRFTLANGVIEYPEIVISTGNVDLDNLMLQQVASARPPKTIGPHAGEPHEFELQLDMLTPFDSFQYNVYRAIDAQKIYPKEAVIGGHGGNTTVDFDYLDAKAQNIVKTKSSGDKGMDKAAIDAVTRAILPVPPPDYSGKLLHMEVVVCYSLETPQNEVNNRCPMGENVIAVIGTRIPGGRF
jgi:hypothetical protein